MEVEQKDFAYIVRTDKDMDDAVTSVLKAVEARKWTVFQVLDISERLRAKGFDQRPLKIIEICSGKYSNRFLNKDRVVSLFMPCRIIVSQEEDGVKVMSMRPTVMSEFFPSVTSEDAADVEADITAIMDDSK